MFRAKESASSKEEDRVNKQKASVIATVTLLVLAVPCAAQQPSPARDPIAASRDANLAPQNNSRTHWNDVHLWLSSATYWGGFTVDALSSEGHAEANPLFRQQNRTANIGLNAAATGGFYVFTLWLQPRHPKAANIMRYLFGGTRIGVGVRNWTYKGVP
jgi:hypothetical protein